MVLFPSKAAQLSALFEHFSTSWALEEPSGRVMDGYCGDARSAPHSTSANAQTLLRSCFSIMLILNM